MHTFGIFILSFIIGYVLLGVVCFFVYYDSLEDIKTYDDEDDDWGEGTTWM